MTEEKKSNSDIVFESLGFKSKPASPEQPLLEMPHSPQEAHDSVARIAFESRINDILQPKNKRPRDRIFVLNLNGLRNALNSKWEKSAKKVHTRLHKILEESMIAHDVFFQKDDVTYFIVFSDIDISMAQLKVQMIAQDMRMAIAGTNEPSLITVQDVQVLWPKMVKFQDTPSRDDIVHAMLSAEDTHRKFVFNQAQDNTSGQLFEDVKFVYRPMLAVRTRVISTYISIPIKPNGHGGYFSGYEMLGAHPSIDNIFELDSLTQEAVNNELKTLIHSNMRSLLALPVHFETLASHRRQQYLTRARELFENNTNRLVYELVGLPDHIPQSRMLEFTAALKPHCRAIMARFPPTHGAFESYRSVGLHAVGVDLYSPNKTEKAIIKILEQFIDHAHQTQLKTYAHGIHSISLYTSAVCAGFDYLDGYALSSVVDKAKDITSFSYDMIYKDLREKNNARAIIATE
jgi:EAL domain-containing protein (putative c-di-GMP-specific phosphodiesterase class I)